MVDESLIREAEALLSKLQLNEMALSETTALSRCSSAISFEVDVELDHWLGFQFDIPPSVLLESCVLTTENLNYKTNILNADSTESRGPARLRRERRFRSQLKRHHEVSKKIDEIITAVISAKRVWLKVIFRQRSTGGRSRFDLCRQIYQK